MDYKEELGMRIKERREELGMTQTELAKKLGYTNRSIISLVEAGKRSLDVDQVRPLAKALEMSKHYAKLFDADIVKDRNEKSPLEKLKGSERIRMK